MAGTHIDASLLTVFMTSTGHIALCSNQLNYADEAKVFGSTGAYPPRAVSDLIDEMLAHMKTAPSDDDLNELAELERSLKYCLGRIRAAMTPR